MTSHFILNCLQCFTYVVSYHTWRIFLWPPYVCNIDISIILTQLTQLISMENHSVDVRGTKGKFSLRDPRVVYLRTFLFLLILFAFFCSYKYLNLLHILLSLWTSVCTMLSIHKKRNAFFLL